MARRMLEVDTSDPAACHRWPGARAGPTAAAGLGYGIVQGVQRGRNEKVHRVVLEHKLGRPLLAGMWALHTCDYSPCCNPEHLYEGTPGRNMRDAYERGRLIPHRGVDRPSARLTEDQVRAIRVDPRSSRTIAQDYPVGKTTIGRIKLGQLWSHVT